ncbi:Putrescine-binding periplasmic protein precursor [compost metagenome]
MTEAALGKERIASWSLLFDAQKSASLKECGIGMQDAPEETFSVLFTYQGRNLVRSSSRRVDRAGEQLLALRREARVLDNTRHTQALQAGELCMTSAWSGLALRAAAQSAQPLEFIIPTEGAPLTITSLAIPSDAARPDLAYQFINYLLIPSNSVRNSQATYFYSSLKPETPELNKLAESQPQLLPTPQARHLLYLSESLSPQLKTAVNRHWQELRNIQPKAGREL